MIVAFGVRRSAFGVWRLAFDETGITLGGNLCSENQLMHTLTNNCEIEIAMRRGKRRLVRRSLYTHLALLFYLMGSRNHGEVGTPNAEHRTPNAS